MLMRNFLFGLALSILVIFSALGGAIADRIFVFKPLDTLLGKRGISKIDTRGELKVVRDEDVVINVAEKVSPSVVTVAISKEQSTLAPLFFDPFGFFRVQPQEEGKTEMIQRDIGSGFIVSGDGLVVTNKHVVSETKASYKVITSDDTEYGVTKIYRDPVVDLAILAINSQKDRPLMAVTMGDSSKLKVGQSVVAIGTALGEFRHTVTTGVISGLARGITAGDPFGGSEELENVIQTDAAINPGNSGGPLLNSTGEVIGVNAAVAGDGQNIGFAIPINSIKDAIANFNQTGQFSRPVLGVRYQMIPKETALLNDVPEGAYVVEVLVGSSADKAGIEKGDIIITIGGEKVKDIKGGLAGLIGKKKVGESLEIELYRDKETKKIIVRLDEAK